MRKVIHINMKISVVSQRPNDDQDTEIKTGTLANLLETEIQKDFPGQQTDILKSPAAFAMLGFALKEYVKNSKDNEADEVDVYIRVNEKTKTLECVFHDNGKGFPATFLGEGKNSNGMISYFDNKLANSEGEERSRIQSDKKSSEVKQRGGQGLGLATPARILKKAEGTFEIGNLSDMSAEIKTSLGIEKTQGAAMRVVSDFYSPELFNKFKTTNNYGQASSVEGFYITHVESIAHRLDPPPSPRKSEELPSTSTSSTGNIGKKLGGLSLDLETDPEIAFENNYDKDIAIIMKTPTDPTSPSSSNLQTDTPEETPKIKPYNR